MALLVIMKMLKEASSASMLLLQSSMHHSVHHMLYSMHCSMH
jgi:hypothetical protein